MKAKIAALALLGAMLAAAAGVEAGMIFRDHFAALDPAWGVASPVIMVKDGKLVVAPEINQTQTLLNQGTLIPNDLKARVSMSFVRADDATYGSGLVFWASDYWNYYALLVNAQGWFAVQRYSQGSYGLPVPWRESDAIKGGAGAANLLQVATRGAEVTVLINGREVAKFQGEPPDGGGLIGVKASSGPQGQDAAAFADLQVLDLEDSP